MSAIHSYDPGASDWQTIGTVTYDEPRRYRVYAQTASRDRDEFLPAGTYPVETNGYWYRVRGAIGGGMQGYLYDAAKLDGFQLAADVRHETERLGECQHDFDRFFRA